MPLQHGCTSAGFSVAMVVLHLGSVDALLLYALCVIYMTFIE